MTSATPTMPITGRILRIAPDVQRAIIADCTERAPFEACGAVIGRYSDAIEATSFCPLPNRAAHKHVEYTIASADVKRVEDAARAQGLSVIGFYHSHPQSAPIPSARDIEAAWPGYVYLIAGTDAGRSCLLGWRLRDDRTRFDSVEVECL